MAMAKLDDDDDIPQLSADTLGLLQDFLSEKDAKAKQFEELKAKAEEDFEKDGQDGKLSMALFDEDWQASQFWYTDATANTLAEQLLAGATSETCIAVVSAPSAYVALRNLLSSRPAADRPVVRLLEFDRRFEVLGSDFVYYDFSKPLALPTELKSSFDHIICDPPFLSEDCQTKTALTVRFLARSWKPFDGSSGDGLKLISCTGERVDETLAKLYGKIGTKMTTFEPEHSKGLSNEFRCYANFESMELKWRDGNDVGLTS
ncbi:Protein-lysine N-methyltransferase efm5 [Recurvomyces mirabilis]|uniref:Protein-lysine N-methyltransferase EFM5 n=1 Tax=Recurvomyces mirabilis TaxID=574656 RepID=A0AAE0WT92_9PEZI|nr:Protein-lysine N-methyltransferase efm5 [Recurvomyces mirabilis]KAK5159296.1 Protein-lysine N-methyltransferase efm5 [Recurvomyces mirabilis]